MNTRDQQQNFRLAGTSTVVETELDDLLLPLHRSGDALAVKVGRTDKKSWSLVSFRNMVGRCVEKEIAYRQDFLFVPVFIAAGVAAWFSLPVTPSRGFLIFLSLGITAIACAFLFRPGFVAGLIKSLALVAFGMLLADFETRRVGTIILDTPVTTTITGTVERRELDARGNWRYVVALNGTSDPKLARPPEKVSVVSRSSHEAVGIGVAIAGKARLSPPSGPALPGLNDFAFASYFNGIGATGFFYGPPKALPGQERSQSWISAADEWLYTLRSNIAQRIRDLIGGDAGAFAASIITDERRAISGETMEALRVSGLAHIVAISGLNMALAAGIFFVGMRTAFSFFPSFSQRWPVKKISAFAALMMTLAYYLISGFAVSAERAWLMMSIMLIAVLVDKPSISLRNVALSAIVIIVLSPHEVMGPSFQMSFAATLALVSGFAFWSRWRGDREQRYISRPPWWLSLAAKVGTIVCGVVVTSLIGGISTAVYSIEHFHRITTYGLMANLAAMPVMSLIVMPFALIGMLLMPFGLDAPFLKIMGYGMAIVIDIAKTVSSWGGDATIGRQNEWFLVTSTVGFLLLALLRTRLTLLGLPFIVAGFAMLSVEQLRSKPDVLIYEDGSLVALVTQEAVATNRQRASGFIYDQWVRALPLPAQHISPDMIEPNKSPDRDDAEGDEPKNGRRRAMSDQEKTEAATKMKAALSRLGSFTCRKDSWCVAKSSQGVSIAVISDAALTATACDIADVVITTRRTSFTTCHSGAILISQDMLRRTGSLELWLGSKGDPVLKAEAAFEGVDRSWTMHRSYDWRQTTFDPTLPAHITEMLSTLP